MVDAKILQFDGLTTLDISVEKILHNIPHEEMESVVVVGVGKSGEISVFGSMGDINAAIVALEFGKMQLLEMAKDNLIGHQA